MSAIERYFNDEEEVDGTFQDVYVVFTNTDTCEGNGRRIVHAVAINRDVAEKLGKGNYVMGTDCPIEVRQGLVFQDSNSKLWVALVSDIAEFYTSYKSIDDKTREAALKKLTPEERRVLGV